MQVPGQVTSMGDWNWRKLIIPLAGWISHVYFANNGQTGTAAFVTHTSIGGHKTQRQAALVAPICLWPFFWNPKRLVFDEVWHDLTLVCAPGVHVLRVATSACVGAGGPKLGTDFQRLFVVNNCVVLFKLIWWYNFLRLAICPMHFNSSIESMESKEVPRFAHSLTASAAVNLIRIKW
jgi:hypothetical protein